ncbi:MAG TPA: LamG-like jellyroll fold domain-containing protein [Chthoniobacteraceae bacterium]|nr:LamG-like jellyroll fold domain-containing protein [Chthoniobacteraceae bacterium]
MHESFAIAFATLLLSALTLHAATEPVIQWSAGDKPREFRRAADVIVLDAATKLHGADGATLEAWVLPRRMGEQVFVARGLPEIGPGGERFHRPAEGWLNFFIGTDARGFLMGCINGNSRMPFPLVTIERLAPGQWHQIVVVKQPDGFQRFHHNGALIHTDTEAEAAGKAWPFRDEEPGEPVRLSVPLGGALGEVAVWACALSSDEIRANWDAKSARYIPHSAPQPISLRPMDEHPGAQPLAPDAASWPRERERVLAEWKKLLGPMPEVAPALDVQTLDETDCGSYVRRKVSIQVQPNDRMPCWLLVPKTLPSNRRAPAIICFYGTTNGAGKDTTVGLSGAKPGSPPQRNRAFALDMVGAGFVALAPDFLRDGERLPLSGRPYDTQDFYERFPDWSCVGKDCWDVQRAVDFLETLPFVQSDRIGMVGHSYGGHTTIFAAGLEPRIRAVFANGPVSDFVLHGAHWAVPKGGGASQSLPSLRPFLLEHRAPPVSFAEVTALMAPRSLWVNQAAGEWRPNEEENAAAVMGLYRTLGAPDRVRYMWCAGDHDFPPAVRAAAVEWFRKWLNSQ